MPRKSNQGQRTHKRRLNLCSLTKLLDPDHQMAVVRDTTFTEVRVQLPNIFADKGLNSYSFSVSSISSPLLLS